MYLQWRQSKQKVAAEREAEALNGAIKAPTPMVSGAVSSDAEAGLAVAVNKAEPIPVGRNGPQSSSVDS
jgi:hypothetical protein